MLEKIKKISDKVWELKQEEKKIKLEEKIEEVKKKWIEEIINEKEINFSDKINSWFNKIDFLELEQEEKAEVAKKVKMQAKPDRLYWIEIFLSGIIASLWLLQNSVAVIIGAMLIAPFLRPINGIAFWIARGEKKFFINSIKVLFISSLISIVMWFILMNVTWLYKETPEILSRTSPNIIDLFIAVFSAMVALLSLRYKRLWESVAWVAMAASLMPPLWVIWMELALWNYNLAWWAFMLFFINIVAIILVWIWAFWLYWFTPNDWWKQKKAFIRIFSVIFLISIVSIPLVKNLLYIKDKWFIETTLKKDLPIILDQKIHKFKIWEINIRELNNQSIKIDLTIKIEEWVKFYDNFKDYINKALSKKIWRKVEVNIELIIVAKIISKEEEKSKELLKKLNLEKIDLENKEKQEKLVSDIKKEFSEEINNKLKKELEEKLQKEFNILLEEKLLKLNNVKTLTWNIDKTSTWKIILNNKLTWTWNLEKK